VSDPEPDRFAAARSVADAVLYEGYVLYPYRASSRKNQLRWQFGVLTPRAFSEADGSERWSTRTECLVAPGSDPRLAVRIRCLQVQHRAVEVAVDGGGFVARREVEIDGQVYVAWDEALDRVVDLPLLQLFAMDGEGYEEDFQLPGGSDTELISSSAGLVAARLARSRQLVAGRIRVKVTRPAGPGWPLKVAVTVENRTEWTGTASRRDEVMGQSLVAVHTMLAVEDGSFVSLLDPPEAFRQMVAECRGDGSFPVLIGGDQVMLSSPIILYDQPEVAPESPGDLYDATEIDEILALRVLTLTDQEKSEARGTDRRAAAIIDRCDEMPPEMWDRLHGAVRTIAPAAPAEPGPTVAWWDPAVDASVDPWTDAIVIAGVEVSKGSAVRLQPSHRADAQDLFLGGMTATVAGVFTDVDGSEHVAVTIDADPATEVLAWQGRYLFFHPDEVEPLSEGAPR
jgi:hypothetical protein